VYNPLEAKYVALTDGLLFVVEASMGSRRGGVPWTPAPVSVACW
jgi:hypothetical protein